VPRRSQPIEIFYQTCALFAVNVVLLTFVLVALDWVSDRLSPLLLALAVPLALVLGGASFALILGKLLRPLANLRDNFSYFTRNGRVPERPIGTRGELDRVIDQLFSLMERMSNCKREVEAQVRERIADLELSRAVSHLLIENPADSAYAESLLVISQSFGNCEGAIFFLSAPNNFSLATTLHGGVEPIDEATYSETLDLVSDPVWRANPQRFGLPEKGVGFDDCVGRSIDSGGRNVACFLLNKREGDWEDSQSRRLSSVADALAPAFAARFKREQDEWTRRESERALIMNERRLRSFVEEAHDMIYSANGADAFIAVNAAGLALLGVDSLDKVIGKSYSDFLLNPQYRQVLLERVRRERSVSDYEIVVRRPDGSSAFCLETANAIFDPDGTVVEVQGIVKDISDRIKNEQTLWKTNLELAEANSSLKRTQTLMVQQEKLASIGQLAAGIAHEINNPLGFLKSNHATLSRFIGTMKRSWDEISKAYPEVAASLSERNDLSYIFSELGAMLAESDEGYSRIMHIVSSLKNFARMDINAEFSPYDLNAGLESSLTMAWNEIKYVAEVEKNLGEIPLVPTLANELNQVFLNILVNAAQAIAGQKREGKGLISVRTFAARDTVVCEISDDGPGIPPEIISRVFDPFFTTKEPGKGTGLGLSISYDIIVNKCQGKISVTSPPAGGARFHIELPIHPQAAAEALEAYR
jgi:two-component system, NtrC family, sensor kinase